MTLTTAIQIYAARCRAKRITTTAGELRAGEWRDAGGEGPLKPHRDAIVAEIARQSEVALNRPLPDTTPANAAMNRCRAKVDELRAFRAELKAARPWSSLGETSTGSFRIADTLVTIRQTEECDWDRYSKSWHRNYGPAKTVSTAITCRRWTGRDFASQSYPQKALRFVDRRATEAVADFLGLPKLRGKAAMRITPHVELIQVASPHKRCTVWERRLAGELLGYVALRRKSHYHDSTAARACDGVTEKIAQDRLRRQRRTATSELTGFDLGRPIGSILRGLGFCADGTRDALQMLDLDDRQYDAGELVTAASWDRLPAVALKYPGETATIGRVLADRAGLIDRLPAEIASHVRRLVAAE